MKSQDAQRHQIKGGAKTKGSINPKTTGARQLRRCLTDEAIDELDCEQ
jgi:hypothetical protein